MELTFSHWGNSLGMRLPKLFADQLGIFEGTKVEATVADGKLVLQPLNTVDKAKQMASEIDLDALVKRITPENMHSFLEFDDKPVGNELW